MARVLKWLKDMGVRVKIEWNKLRQKREDYVNIAKGRIDV